MCIRIRIHIHIHKAQCTHLRREVHVRAALHQQRRHVHVPVVRRDVQRREPALRTITARAHLALEHFTPHSLFVQRTATMTNTPLATEPHQTVNTCNTALATISWCISLNKKGMLNKSTRAVQTSLPRIST